MAILTAGMDLFIFPLSAFVSIDALRIADIDPIYIALICNQILAVAICLLLMKWIVPDWEFHFNLAGISGGFKRYGAIGIVAFAVSLFAFAIGLMPFDRTPSPAKVIVECVVYYFCVAFIEELYVRGLLLNVLRKWLGGRDSHAVYAVLITALIFGLGHVPGTLGQPMDVIIFKILWTVGLGIYWGAIYVKTNSLWCAILSHFILDLCALPFAFSTRSDYPRISLLIIVPLFILMGLYGFRILRNGPETGS